MSKRVSRMVVRCFPQASNFLASFLGIAVYMCILLYMYKPSGKHSNGKSSNKNGHLKGTITELNAVISSTPCLITRVLGIIRRCDDTNSMANTGYKLTKYYKMLKLMSRMYYYIFMFDYGEVYINCAIHSPYIVDPVTLWLNHIN